MSSFFRTGDEAEMEASGPIDPAQEVELWWGGYAGRTMVPAFVVCALLSAAVLLLADLIWRGESVPTGVISHFAMYLIVLVWGVTLVRWAYFTTAIAYRLTTRRLLREQGFAHPARPALDLANIRGVRVEQRTWERWVGVGHVHIDVAGGPGEVLAGVHNPQHVADALLRQAEVSRSSHKENP